MFGKKRIRELNRCYRKKLYEQEFNAGSYHSILYHRHFEGYTEYKRQDGKHTKIERVYTGDWYRQELTPARYIVLRLFYLASCFLMAWLMFSTALAERKSDMVWYVAVSEFVTLLFLTTTGYVLLVNYIFAPRKMTMGDFKSSSVMLKRCLAGTAASFVADAGLVVLFLALHHDAGSQADVYAAGRFLAGALTAFILLCIERRVPYKITASKGEVPGNGTEITCID